MTRLAWASLRHRRSAIVSSLLSVFLVTAIVTGFASMLDTAFQSGAHGAHGADRTTLIIIAAVVGGWGAVIVASAVATPLRVATRQRATELALLRSVGASPAQVVRLIMRETWLVAGAAALLALPAGRGGGVLLLSMLRDTHQVSGDIGYRFGPAGPGIGLGLSLAAAMIATRWTARRAARRRVRDALFEAAVGGRRMSRGRFWAGLIAIGLGVQSSISAMTLVDGKNVYDVQMFAADGCIFAAIGFALLGPAILARAVSVLAPLVRRIAGVSGELSMAAVRQRVQQAATPLMPIIVVTSIATGTLYIGDYQLAAQVKNADDKSVATLNYVIVGMITLFAAVMLVNLLVATICDRRREFAQQRLAGATPRQLLGLVTAESGLLLAVGVPFGTVGGLLTVIPFSVKTTHRVIPNASIGIYLGVVVAVIALTIGASLTATRRSTRTDAITVLSGATRA
jgi:putative ABC transport system permease protein